MSAELTTDYRDGDTIYLLLPGKEARGMLEDWLRAEDADCDLVVHRSHKNPGCVVVETRCLRWAYRVLRWYRVKQVNIRSIND